MSSTLNDIIGQRLVLLFLIASCIIFLNSCRSTGTEAHSSFRRAIDVSRIIDLNDVERACIESAGNHWAEEELREFLHGKAVTAIIAFERVREAFGPKPAPLVAEFKRHTPVGDTYLRTYLSMYAIDKQRALALEQGQTYQLLANLHPLVNERPCETAVGHLGKEYMTLFLTLKQNNAVIRAADD